MSVRRFGVLLRGLPPSARTWAKENGRWSTTDHLLALNADLTHLVYRGAVGPHLKRSQQPEPFQVPRPGDKPKRSESGWAAFIDMAPKTTRPAKKRGG